MRNDKTILYDKEKQTCEEALFTLWYCLNICLEEVRKIINSLSPQLKIEPDATWIQIIYANQY
jgi:hypothetical protein